MGTNFDDIPDEVWRLAEPLLPARPPAELGGRPRRNDRRILAGIVYRLRTGCQWKAIPRTFGTGSTIHRRFCEWTEAGFFTAFFARVVREYQHVQGLDLKWASLDSSMVKAPKGGTERDRTPRIEASPESNATS